MNSECIPPLIKAFSFSGTPAKGKVVKGLKTLTPGKSLTQHESRQELLTDDSPKVKKRKSYDKPLPKPPDKNDFLETKRSSVASLLPSLATNEEKFFSLVEDGNVAAVMQFLKVVLKQRLCHKV